jgi:glycosyltransferase involved in cell wall biosynthesis
MIAPPDESAARPLSPKRIDLHCHSDASNRAAEVLLNAIACPECYSSPQQVYAQAKRRGMDFVTVTDHDSIDGVLKIADRDDVLVGEELTCWFPEDDCKMHVLMWGITPAQHAQAQGIARDIYAVARYFHQEQIAHAVAHPIYRQNDKLERWHLERLLLLFKGFECLNGAHSALHRDAFEPLLDNLSRSSLGRLAEQHDLAPLWPEPWIKSRTAGSDDHGLLNIGRTWTEFPAGTATRADLLQCIRDGTCKPGGESGSSTKLAHTFFSVGVRYYTREILAPAAPAGPPPKRRSANLPTMLLQMIVGEAAMPTRGQLVRRAVQGTLRRLGRRLAAPFRKTPPPGGTAMLRRLFFDSVRRRIAEHPNLRRALDGGLPPLGEHDEMFRFVQDVNRDVTAGVAAAIGQSVADASFTGLFDAIASILAQQFILLPYYFSVFHQNREKRLLRVITGQRRSMDAAPVKVGLFTDTLDETNGVTRFLRDMSVQAARAGCALTVHTCVEAPRHDLPNRKNFSPMLSREMPYYPGLPLNLPPVLEILEWADRQQFDAIHVSTPGPMGVCGWLVAQMLRVPLVGTYHTDFPAYIEQYTRDHRAVHAAGLYMGWLYGQMATVFTRSRGYVHALRGLGIADGKLQTLLPGVDTEKFHPRRRDDALWAARGVAQSRRLLYCGRISAEKNLPLLVTAFRQLCALRHDVALVLAGEGPYLPELRQDLAGLPAYFLGTLDDDALAAVYASADLLVFPSRTDTLGQVVMEAQASGLPALVSNEGGPMETVEDGQTGLVLPATNPAVWAQAMYDLLNDEARRARMAAAAPARMARHSLAKTFDAFWAAHVAAAEPVEERQSADQAAMSV